MRSRSVATVSGPSLPTERGNRRQPRIGGRQTDAVRALDPRRAHRRAIASTRRTANRRRPRRSAVPSSCRAPRSRACAAECRAVAFAQADTHEGGAPERFGWTPSLPTYSMSTLHHDHSEDHAGPSTCHRRTGHGPPRSSRRPRVRHPRRECFAARGGCCCATVSQRGSHRQRHPRDRPVMALTPRPVRTTV